MTIHRNRLQFEGRFTQVPNAWLRDDRISHRARGFLHELLSHDPGWEVSQESLENEHEGRHAVRGAIRELIDAGYLEVRQGRNGNRFGKIEYNLRDPFRL